MGAFDKLNWLGGNFRHWFTERRFPSSHLRLSALLMNSLYFVLALTLTLIVYKNITILNEYVLIFIKAGSVALVIGTFFVLKYAHKIVKNLKYGFHGLANGYKFLIVLAILLLALSFYHRQEQYMPTIKGKLDAVNFTYFNPIYLEPGSITKLSDQSDSITGRVATQDYDESKSKSFIDTILPSSEPISEKTKEIEKKIFELVNKERQSHGKSQLRWNDQLAEVARDHSLDMAETTFSRMIILMVKILQTELEDIITMFIKN